MKRFLPLILAGCLTPAFGQTVVVLPFFNLSDSASLDWIGESVAETVRETLDMEDVLVLDRESRAEAYRRLAIRPYVELTRASVIKLAELLDAERVVYGSFKVSQTPEGTSSGAGGSLELTARVLDLRQLKQSPEESVGGPLQDLDVVQENLSWQLLTRLLEPEKVPSEEQFRGRRKPVRLDALESYIRGLLAASPEQQHRYFTQAARLQEGFSQPCFQLGRLQWSAKDYKVATGWFERVKPGDPHYLESQFFLGLSRYYLGEYSKAQEAFQQVVASLPLNEVWNNLGAAQSRRDGPEAVESFRKAVEGDPNDPTYRFNLGYALWKRGDYEAGAEELRAALRMSRDDPQATLVLGRCLNKTLARRTETLIEGFERIKTNYEEMAYRQLRATLAPRAK
jgi:tetratricopeptide (TPR) repeat protein